MVKGSHPSLLEGLCEKSRASGSTVESYPETLKVGPVLAPFLHNGIVSMFKREDSGKSLTQFCAWRRWTAIATIGRETSRAALREMLSQSCAAQ